MKSEILLEELENLAEKLGLELRYEKGDFQGDLCFIKEEGVLIVQKSISVDRKIAVLSKGLTRVDLGNVYILPELRKLLEPVEEQENENDEEAHIS